jgi:hypothetical protein
MAELKTQKTDGDVDAFLDAIEDEARREDCKTVRALMEEVVGAPATMWGKAIVGFGSYHYTYASGREGDWMEVGFSPRKQNLTLYIMPGFGSYDDLMARLGKFKTGKSCLYIKKLTDVDMDVLRELVTASIADIRERHPAPA